MTLQLSVNYYLDAKLYIELNNKIKEEQNKQKALKQQVMGLKSRYEEAVRGTGGAANANIDPNSHQKSMGKDLITLQNEIKVITHEIEELNAKKKALLRLWQLQVNELDKKYETQNWDARILQIKGEIKEWKEKYKQLDQKTRSQRNMSEETHKEILGTHYQLQNLKSQMALLKQSGDPSKMGIFTQR